MRLRRQGQERGKGREEHRRQDAYREGPGAQTPRPPWFGSPETGIISSGINTFVKLSVSSHYELPSVPVKNSWNHWA